MWNCVTLFFFWRLINCAYYLLCDTIRNQISWTTVCWIPEKTKVNMYSNICRYCSNFYSEYAEPIELCDWCRSDQERSTARHGGSSKKSSVVGGVETGGASSRSEYSGDHKIKQHDHQQHRDHQDGGGSGSGEKASKNSGVPSPRPTARRYKLLKDVMC